MITIRVPDLESTEASLLTRLYDRSRETKDLEPSLLSAVTSTHFQGYIRRKKGRIYITAYGRAVIEAWGMHP